MQNLTSATSLAQPNEESKHPKAPNPWILYGNLLRLARSPRETTEQCFEPIAHKYFVRGGAWVLNTYVVQGRAEADMCAGFDSSYESPERKKTTLLGGLMLDIDGANIVRTRTGISLALQGLDARRQGCVSNPATSSPGEIPRTGHHRIEKTDTVWYPFFYGEEYWHMDEPISREKADLLCRSISLAFSGVKLIVSIASEKLYVIISLSG